ncbi:DUF488 domain-containing protein [Salinisphaera sp. LB1]|uniref:DUF488 domain-containing protein n=1 Tax=Salinisphaera sp. LB1 TaxID=2183911 RepID=UPI000D705AB8|nr:DUF488 domain-containing protein [Salinisphaera sp. LB1]AWN15756.1 putative uroporphyrin-III c-methyltransferase [Salinisphaera sp. LB1]
MRIRLKRIYDDVADDDGYRVLVDRIWPRGVAKKNARLDAWSKELAPSNELRRWFGHDRERWEAFCRAYRAELDECDPQAIDELRRRADTEGLTLLFAARDTECNNAVVLADYLESR